MRTCHSLLALSGLVLAAQGAESAEQPKLVDLVNASRTCRPDPGDGMICTFRIGDTLHITFYKVGEPGTVVRFQHSDVSKQLYAVWYPDCVAVLPGRAPERTYDENQAAFISPRNAVVYMTLEQCQAAR
jgi:hypothetical protein